MKVLIIKTSSLGDIIHTLPAITDGARAVRGIKFDWVVEESFSEVPQWHPNVRRVIPVALRRWRKNPFRAGVNGEFRRFYSNLRREKYDMIIDAQGLIKSAFIGLLAQGSRIGFDRGSIKEPLSSLTYSRRIFVRKGQHAIQRVRQLFASSLGYPLPSGDPDYGFDQNLFPSSPSIGRGLVFIQGTSQKRKKWSPQSWVQLTQLANQKGWKVFFPWGNNSEKREVEQITTSCKNVSILPKKNLTELAGILRSSQGVVAVDTGLSHLAAALGVPTVTLYLNTTAKLVGTFGQHQNHLEKEKIPPSEVWHNLVKFLPVLEG